MKLLLLHLVGVPYYFTYIDDARSHTNQGILRSHNYGLYSVPETLYPKRAFKFKMVEGRTSARQARYVIKNSHIQTVKTVFCIYNL
jgi:hypothetical protein